MAGVGVLALGVEPLIDGHPWLFAVGYVIARTAVWPLWWSGRRGAGAMRPLLWGPGVSALWLLTPLVPEHLLGWALAALAFLEMSLLLLRPDGKESDAPRLSGPHLVERIDLFVMIVLGESVVQIVDSLDTERTAMTWLTADCSAHLHPGSLTCLCLGMILVHVGTQSLTRQAFATNLGLKPRRRPQTAAERAQMRREQAAVREERARDATGAPHDPQGPWHAILGGLTQLATYLAPVVIKLFLVVTIASLTFNALVRPPQTLQAPDGRDVVVTTHATFAGGTVFDPSELNRQLVLLAHELGRANVADLCVAYSLSHQFVDSLAIGTRSNQQMIDDLAYCLNAPLTADERDAVEERLDAVVS